MIPPFEREARDQEPKDLPGAHGGAVASLLTNRFATALIKRLHLKQVELWLFYPWSSNNL